MIYIYIYDIYIIYNTISLINTMHRCDMTLESPNSLGASGKALQHLQLHGHGHGHGHWISVKTRGGLV